MEEKMEGGSEGEGEEREKGEKIQQTFIFIQTA